MNRGGRENAETPWACFLYGLSVPAVGKAL
jgi:hypothetical protein